MGFKDGESEKKNRMLKLNEPKAKSQQPKAIFTS